MLNNYIYKIDPKYVSESCVQIMVPCYKSLSIINSEDINLYYLGHNGDNFIINNYFQDSRKYNFPYYNIPYHHKKRLFSNSILYINQLFEFNKSYLLVYESGLIQYNIFKFNNESYVSVYQYSPDKYSTSKYFNTTDELYNYFKNISNNNKAYMIDSYGKHIKPCYDKNERYEKFNKYSKEICKSVKKCGSNYYVNFKYYLKNEDIFMVPVNSNLYLINFSNLIPDIKYIRVKVLEDECTVLYSKNITYLNEPYFNNIDYIENFHTIEEPRIPKKILKKL